MPARRSDRPSSRAASGSLGGFFAASARSSPTAGFATARATSPAHTALIRRYPFMIAIPPEEPPGVERRGNLPPNASPFKAVTVPQAQIACDGQRFSLRFRRPSPRQTWGARLSSRGRAAKPPGEVDPHAIPDHHRPVPGCLPPPRLLGREEPRRIRIRRFREQRTSPTTARASARARPDPPTTSSARPAASERRRAPIAPSTAAA